MKLNNNGITLTEIIISIALISIVLIFLFSLLVTVNDINDESEVNSTYLINKSLILKNIESDLTKATSIEIKNCTPKSAGGTIISSFYEAYDGYINTITDNKLRAKECKEIVFDGDSNNKAYLAIYYHNNKSKYVISYIHGDIKATRELPKFEKYNVTINAHGNPQLKNWEIKGNFNNGFATLKIPIIGSDGKDYSIIISYYGKV